MYSAGNRGSIPSENRWIKIFVFVGRLDPPQIRSKLQNRPKSGNIFVFPISVVGTKLVSLDAGQCKKGISVSSYHQAEKTSKYCSNVRISNTWLKGAAFGHFLSLVVTYSTNSLFAVTSIKRHRFRVPTFKLFGPF